MMSAERVLCLALTLALLPAAPAAAATPKSGKWRIVSMTGEITGESRGMGCGGATDPARPMVDERGTIHSYFTEWADSAAEARADLLEEHYLLFQPDREHSFLFALGFQQAEAEEPGYYSNEGGTAPLEGLEFPSRVECFERWREDCAANPGCNETAATRAGWETTCRDWLRGDEGSRSGATLEDLENLLAYAGDKAGLGLWLLTRTVSAALVRSGRVAGGTLDPDGDFRGFEVNKAYMPGTKLGGISAFYVRGTVTSPTELSGTWEYRGSGNSGMCQDEEQGSGRFEATWAGR